MFKRSKRKIVAAIMSILVILWVGTLGVIYASSYLEMTRQNEQMLKVHADMYVPPSAMEGRPPDMSMPNNGNPGMQSGFADSPKFQLTTFYTVALTYDGEIIEIKNDQPNIYTDDDLKKLAQSIIEEDKEVGVKKNLAFYKTDKGGYMLVTLMDNTIINETAATLFRHTLLFGGAALILFFFLSVFLAGKIVQPLEDSYKKQKQFISDAGHELKTPVSVVNANAELLSREIGDNQWLANIQYENERMGILVNQLLDLARTESVTPQMEHIDFSRLVSGEALPFESVAYEKGLVLNMNVPGGIAVEGNSSQLKQITSILLDNAIRHSAPSGEVYLKLTREHGFAKLSVINKGDEIPASEREQLFEQFYRVDTARNGEDRHYGLGLAIAKAIAAAHKGHIEVVCYNGLVEFQLQIPAL